jgi:hypothetical protein
MSVELLKEQQFLLDHVSEAFVLLVRHVQPQKPPSVFLSLQQQPVLLLLHLLLWQISWLSLLQLQPR